MNTSIITVILLFLFVIRHCLSLPLKTTGNNGYQNNNGNTLLVYSRDFLLNLRPRDTSCSLFDPRCNNNNNNKSRNDAKQRKRGKKGGVRERLKRRGWKPPMPSIILSNVRSIRNKIDILSALCKYESDYRNCCALCLTETWLTDLDNDSSINMDNFTLFRTDRNPSLGKSKGGGVCAYINKSWCTNIKVLHSVSHPDFELLSLALRPFYLPREFNQINLVVAYIPPNAKSESATEQIESYVHSFINNNPDAPVVIVGDFNHCRLDETCFKQYVSCATRKEKTIDLCYSNIPNAYKAVNKPRIANSDHYPVHLIPTYLPKIKREKPVVKQQHAWNDNAVESLQACFEQTLWENLTPDTASIDEWTDTVCDYINFCQDLCVEKKTFHIHPNNKPWVTKKLKCLINERNKAFKNNDKVRLQDIKMKLKSAINKAKREYKDKMEKNMRSSNSSQAWEMLRGMGGLENKKRNKSDSACISVDVNTLNEFYCRFDKPLNEQENQHCNVLLTNDTPDIDANDVTSIFKNLKARKAPGPDGLCGRILKECSEQLGHVFAKLFQRSIDESAIPIIWKTSTIIPVPKVRCPTQPNDLRPVALTSIPMKCLERILKCHLLQDVSRSLDSHQFAYQLVRGVEDALLTVIDKMMCHLDGNSSHYARLLFVDFSSAFNAMDSKILINKLKNMGVSNFLIKWYQQFLFKRPQRVKLNEKFSDVKYLSNGCPQGCVSSPILYIIYTNDCIAQYDNCSIIKYADDTAILGLLDSSMESLEKYTNEIKSFTEWCQQNSLKLNVKKTKELIFDLRKNPTNHQAITISDEPVEIVKYFKYLGVHIDCNLNFKFHVENVCKKLNQRIYILRKLQSFNVSRKTMTMMYNSLVLSIACFSMTAWYGSLGVKEKSKLQSTIKRAGKIAKNNVDSVPILYKNEVIKKCNKIIKNRTHPLKIRYDMLPSGRRYCSIKTRTNRYKSTFVPTSVNLLNKEL